MPLYRATDEPRFDIPALKFTAVWYLDHNQLEKSLLNLRRELHP
jgi:hypothetical protein